MPPATYSVFRGDRLLRRGPLAEVLAAMKLAPAPGTGSFLVFEDATGRELDFDLRGTLDEVLARVTPAEPPKGRGRPRLGVERGEVTLLPRHWEWLSRQPNGASAALRRLVEGAMHSSGREMGSVRDAAYRVMSALAGDRPGFEEASRALFAGDMERFTTLTARWPVDIRSHLAALLAPPPRGVKGG